MFKKILISLIYLSFLTCINAQNIQAYSNISNTAEEAIIKKQYDKALLNYKSLKTQNYIFSRDIYNAIICSNKLKNWDELYYWAKLFISKGAVPSFFIQTKFKDFRKTSYWNKINKLKVENIVNKDLIKSLDSLTITDQELFVKLKEDPTIDAFSLTEKIDKKLFALEKIYGPLTDENTGVNIENDTIYSFRPKYAVLYRHSYQSHKQNSFFNEKVKNNQLERILYYNSIDYNLMPILDYQNKLYFLKEDFLPQEYKDDFMHFFNITKTAYKNKDFTEYSFYYPIFKFQNFVDEESTKNFEQVLKEMYQN
jgi:hypothetical protein